MGNAQLHVLPVDDSGSFSGGSRGPQSPSMTHHFTDFSPLSPVSWHGLLNQLLAPKSLSQALL